MSLSMVFRAANGVLVVADGREVFDEGGGIHRWQSDTARKVSLSAGPSPVVGVAVGLAAVGAGDASQDVIELIDGVFQSERPTFGVASGDGPWTARAAAHEARRRAEQRMEGLALGSSTVLGAVVDWQADSSDPSLWTFELRAVDVRELNNEDDPFSGYKEVRLSASSERVVDDFKTTRFAAFPEGCRVWQALRHKFDHTMQLLDIDAELDDPRWHSPFKFPELSVEALAQHVASALLRLQDTDLDAFHTSEVGGVWVFAHLYPGEGPTFVLRSLGPHHAEGGW